MAITVTNLYADDGEPLGSTTTGFGPSKIVSGFLAVACGNPGPSGTIGGAQIYDVTSPEAMSSPIFTQIMVDKDGNENTNPTCRFAIIHGIPKTAGALLICGARRGEEDGSEGGNNNSIIFAVDISDNDPANWAVDTVGVPFATNHDYIDTKFDNNNAGIANGIPQFSDGDYDGTKVTVWAQISGVWNYDPTNLAAGPAETNNDQSAHGFETQGGTVLLNGPSAGQRWTANYTDSTRVLTALLADLALDAGIIPREMDDEASGKTLRPWDFCQSDNGQFIFGSYSSSASTAGQTANSGMQVYDARDPAAPIWLSTEKLPESARDVWTPRDDFPSIGVRDPACLRICQVDGFVFVSNLGKGYAIWDCRNPLSPIFMGTFPNSLQTAANDIDTISGLVAWEDGGDYYVAYKAGYHDANQSTKKFYLDRIEGLKMSLDYIGNFQPTGTASGVDRVVSNSVSLSVETTGINGSRIYGPVLGTETIDEVGAFAGNGSAPENLIFGIYEATSAVDATPMGNPLFGPDTVPVIDVPLSSRTLVVAHSLAPHIGKFLTMGVTADTTGIDIEANVAVAGTDLSRDNTTGGSLPTPWSDDASLAFDLEMWYQVNIPDVSMPPTLDTPYVNQSVTLGDTINIDLTTAWTGATSFVVSGLPVDVTATAGVISGVIVGSGARSINVQAINDAGTNTDSFILEILSGLPNKT